MGFEAGEQVGRYKLLKKLGAGSFAEVWKAEEQGHVGFSKEVALKIVRAPVDGEERDESLLREARLCANLRHPNIVDILGVEEHDGVIQVAMEFVDGGTLADLISRVRTGGLVLPRSIVLDIGIGLGRALHRAHTHTREDGSPGAIIHRDLKPANILLSKAGAPKVADFGLAKATGEMTATATGTLKGTPAYIAPELWEGGREFKPSVDLFAVGAILYEMVMLERLFQGQSLPLIYGQVFRGSSAEEASHLAGIFPELVPVVEKAIQRDPEKRYQSASELISDLQKLRRDALASGEVEDFMDLIHLTELPMEERELPSSSQFRVPETADPGWQAVIAEALGTRVPLDPSASGKSISTLEMQIPGGGDLRTTAMLPPVVAAGGAEEDLEVGSSLFERPAEVGGAVQPPAGTASRWPMWVALVLVLGAGVAGGLMFGPGLLPTGTPSPPAAPPEASPVVQSAPADEPVVVTGSAEAGEEAGPEPEPAEAPLPGAEAGEEPGELVQEEAPSGEEAGLAESAEAVPAAAPVPEPVPAPEAVPPTEPVAVAPAAPVAQSVPPVESSAKSAPAEQVSPAPQEAEAPLPALADGEACVLVTSAPGGARVWVDGAPQARRAGRASPTQIRRAPGSVKVGMGTGDAPSMDVSLSIRGGTAVSVHCDFLVARSCKASAASAERCRQ